jgi:hypothetical protein
MNSDKIDQLVNEAIDAMFVPVVKAYPEITTGDFAPDQEMALRAAVREAIIAWVWNNSNEEF